MLRTHYRSPFNFSDAHLEDARTALRGSYTALDARARPGRRRRSTGPSPRAAAFKAAMDDDFNTPGAMAVLFDLANEVNRDRSPRRAAPAARRWAARSACCSRTRAPTCKAASRSTRPRIAGAHRGARRGQGRRRTSPGPTRIRAELAARASC